MKEIDPKDKKIATLEQQVTRLLSKVSELNQQVNLLLRENNRRKSEVSQISAAIKRG
jgi:regulator of replication initiation timing